MFGHKKTSDPRLIVVYTIGSTRVTASILEIQLDAITCVYTTQSPLDHQEQLDLERLTHSMLSALKKVSVQIQKEGLQKVRTVLGYDGVFDSFICIYTAPWFVSQTRMVTLKRKKAFVVTSKLTSKLLNDEITTFKKNLLEENSPYKHLVGADVVDAYSIRTKVNDYKTKKPFGKQANSLTLSVYVSLMSSEMLRQTHELLKNTFHTDAIQCYSSTLVTYLATESLFKGYNSYLILEVNGEITDVSIVKDGVLLETASYPAGTNNLIRFVSQKTKLTKDDILSRLKLMTLAQTDRSTKKTEEVESMVYEAVSEWMQGLHRALERVSKGSPVPQVAFLLIDPVWEVLYQTALKDHSTELFTFSNHPFTVITINPEFVSQHVERKEGTDFLPLMLLTGIMHKKLPGN